MGASPPVPSVCRSRRLARPALPGVSKQRETRERRRSEAEREHGQRARGVNVDTANPLSSHRRDKGPERKESPDTNGPRDGGPHEARRGMGAKL
jgi:hypothetical protein